MPRKMFLNAPKEVTWFIALILGVLGILAHFAFIPVLSVYAFWLIAIAFVLLVLAPVLEGL